MTQKRAIVFFSAGLGDAVLLIPLIKHLKEQDFKISGFFTSQNPCEEIFENTDLLDEIIVKKTKWQQLVFSITYLLKFNKAFVNYFATNRSNLLWASFLSKEVIINKKEKALFQSKIKYIEPKENIHDSQQNLNLLLNNAVVSLPDFWLNFKSNINTTLPKLFIAVQISAGNNKVQYKNWPINYWVDFLEKILKEYPEQKIVLLGDKNEINLSQKITEKFGNNIQSFIGKTSVLEAMQIIHQSDYFIGLDGGLMHLAIALNKPTFTIWGASSIKLYGYEQFSGLHKCVSLHLPCNPCNAWINANTSKASNPEKCPDYACLKELTPEKVFSQWVQYVNSLIHVH